MATRSVQVVLSAITSAYRAEMLRAARDTNKVQAAASGATGAMAPLGASMGKTAGSGSKLGMAANNIAARMGPMGTAMLGAARNAAFMTGVLAGPTALGAAMIGSAKAAIQFESDFTRVKKTVEDRSTPQQLEDLAMGFRQMSTEIPATTTEITAVGAAAGQLGIRTANIESFTETMIKLGYSTNLSAEDAAMSLAQLANVTRLPESQFENLGSTVVWLGNNLATTEDQIVRYGQRLAGAGEIVGLTEAEILGLGATMSELGIPAERGGTAMQKVLLTIHKSVDEGGDKMANFAEVAGMSADQFASKWKTKPAEAIVAFIKGLNRLEKSGGSAALALDDLGLKDQRLVQAFLSLAGAADDIQGNMDGANQAFRENIALTEEADRFASTTENRIKMLGNAFRDLGVELGNATLPALATLADHLKKVVVGGTDLLRGLGGEGGETLMERAGLHARDILRSSLGIEQLSSVIDKMTGHVELNAQQLHEAERFGGRYSGILPDIKEGAQGVAAGTEDMADAMGGAIAEVEDLTDAQKRMQSGLAGFANPMNVYNDLLKKKEDAERDAAQATVDSTKKSSSSWRDHAKDVNVSMGELIKGLQTQIKEYRNWEKNLVTIAKRGRADVAKQLAEMGPEGAKLAATFANASDKEFKKGTKLWSQTMRIGGDQMTRDLDKKLDNAATTAKKGGQKVSDRIAERFADAKTRANKQMNNIPPGVRAAMSNAEKNGRTGAQRTGDAMNRELANRARKWARIVAGYGSSLSAGLNPVLAALKAGQIKSTRDASIRAIERAIGAAADGALVTRADGGIDVTFQQLLGQGANQLAGRPQAHITRTPRVLYGEPETGGEAYIPLAAGKRPRSRQIAAETVNRLGGEVMWFAKGGFQSPGDVPKPPGSDGTALGRTGVAAMRHAYNETRKWVKENAAPQLGNAPGVAAMMAALKKAFPNIYLISGLRPGAITSTGNQSYHALGRAVDIPPWASVFNWIVKNYKARTKELIFTPMGGRQIKNGQNHVFSGGTIRQDHYNHIHWAMKMGGMLTQSMMKMMDRRLNQYFDADFDASLSKRFAKWPGVNPTTLPGAELPFGAYDSGGFLPQGLSLAYNGTGAPEPVGNTLAGSKIVIEVPGLGTALEGIVRNVGDQTARTSRVQARKRGR